MEVVATWQQQCPRRTLATTGGGHEKSPAVRGFPQCAREDSNLHGPFSPQGPQPCASTNSATGAWAASITPAAGLDRVVGAVRSSWAPAGGVPPAGLWCVVTVPVIPRRARGSGEGVGPSTQGFFGRGA
jgi:hypothetical protein